MSRVLTSPHALGAAARPTHNVSVARRAATASATGTAVEYYEFGVYGYMAAIIGPLFFPGDNPAASLLAVLAVFGSAFLVRPLGGVVLGRLGDRIGRRAVLLTTVIGMGVATAAIGLLPTAMQVGTLAPVLLVLIRLVQGFFAGAEVIGAAAFVAESSPTGRRGFFGAFTPVGVALGGACAAVTCGLTTALLSDAQLHEWGWRIPFLLSIPLAMLSCRMRHNVEETPAFKAFLEKEQPPKAPIREVLASHRGALVKVILLTFGQNAGYWIGLVFMNIYLTTYLGFNKTDVFWVIASISLCMAAMMPFWGALSDRLGRRKVLAVGFTGYVLLVIPMMLVMGSGSLWLAALAMFVATLPMPVIQSVGYPTYAEQFPTRVRYTAMAISINMGAIMGGGITPYIVTSIIGKTQNLLTPGYFMAGAALCALLSLLALRETAHGELAQ